MRLLAAIRYYWITAAGFRLRPWKSPYLRWRLETYFGPKANVRGAGDLWRLLWAERKHMVKFLDWVETRQGARDREKVRLSDSHGER